MGLISVHLLLKIYLSLSTDWIWRKTFEVNCSEYSLIPYKYGVTFPPPLSPVVATSVCEMRSSLTKLCISPVHPILFLNAALIVPLSSNHEKCREPDYTFIMWYKATCFSLKTPSYLEQKRFRIVLLQRHVSKSNECTDRDIICSIVTRSNKNVDVRSHVKYIWLYISFCCLHKFSTPSLMMFFRGRNM
jgi:hypothetical protein